MRISLSFLLAGICLLFLAPAAQAQSAPAKRSRDSLSTEERRQIRQNMNILLGLPEGTGAESKSGKGQDLGLNSPLYQKGLSLFKEGLTRYMDGDYEGATSLFRQVLDLDPLHKNAYAFLERALDEMEGASDPGRRIQAADDLASRKNELFFQAGLEKYLQGDYSAAAKLWRALAEEAPAFEKAFVHLKMAEEKLEASTRNFYDQGLFYYGRGDVPKALAEWKKGLSLNPGSGRLKNQLALAEADRKRLVEMALAESRILAASDDRDAAAIVLRKMLEKYPGDLPLSNALAELDRDRLRQWEAQAGHLKTAYEKGRLAEVVDSARSLLLENPENLLAREYAAKASESLRRDSGKARNADRFERGRRLQTEGRAAEALVLFLEIEADDPRYPGLAEAKAKAQAETEALDRRRQAAEALDRGMALFEKGLFTGALKEWREGLVLDPGNEMLSAYVKEAGKKMDPSHDAQKKRARDEKEAARLNQEALGKYREKKFGEALLTLKKAQALNPGDATLQKAMTVTRQELVREEERRMSDLDRKTEKLFYAGIDFYRKGNYKKALECWNELVTLKPDHKKARKYIENVSQKLEKIEKI